MELSFSVSQSIWNGQEQSPDNALRTLALSPQLVSLLWEQIARQKAKDHKYLFSASTGSPWDMNAFRKRMRMESLAHVSWEFKQAGFHAFRHFNVSLMDALSVPLKVIQERIGHALTGSFTLDVYGGKPEWAGNVSAAQKVGAAIAQALEKEKAERDLSA